MSASIKKVVERVLQISTAVVVAGLPLLFSRTAMAATATLSLSPASGSVSNGSYLTVGVYENSGSEPVNAVQANLSYPTGQLTFVSIISSSNFSIDALSSGGSGSVKVGKATVSAVTGSKLVASVRFLAKASSGSASIGFAGGSTVASANSNTNILAGTSGGSYTLTVPPVAPPPPPKDTTAPTITVVKVSDLTFNGATITWTTSEPATSEVDYGLDTKYGLSSVDANLVTAHKVTLNSSLLTPNTTFHYVVKSSDGAGNAATSPDSTFTTKGLSLVVTVINQKSKKPVSGAVVTIAAQSGTTGSSGQTTVNNLPLGKQTASVKYKGNTTAATVQIQTTDTKGTTKPVIIPITVSALPWLIIIIVLAVILVAGALIWKLKSGKNKGSPPGMPGAIPMNPTEITPTQPVEPPPQAGV